MKAPPPAKPSGYANANAVTTYPFCQKVYGREKQNLAVAMFANSSTIWQGKNSDIFVFLSRLIIHTSKGTKQGGNASAKTAVASYRLTVTGSETATHMDTASAPDFTNHYPNKRKNRVQISLYPIAFLGFEDEMG